MSLCLLCGVSAGSLARTSAAEELSTFRLSWLRGDGAESCPGAQELERAVEARLGRDPFGESAEQALEVSVTRSGDTAWHVRIRARDATGKAIGSRDLDTEASDCRAIADAIALAVALAIDPNAELGPAPPPLAQSRPATVPSAPGPAAGAVCPATPTCSAPPPCRCPPPARATTRGTFTGRALLAEGILPGVAYGASVGGDFAMERWHATLGLHWLAETQARGLAFGLSTAALGTCFDAVRSNSTTLGICAAVELGAMHSVVTDPNLVPDGPHEQFWMAVELGPRLGWRGPGPLFAELGGSLVAPVTRPEFGVRNEQNPRFQPDLLGGIGFVGLGVAVP